MNVILKTKSLVIRDYRIQDLKVIHDLVQPVEIYKFQHWGPNSFKDTENFIMTCLAQQKQNPRCDFELCIEDKNQQVVGAIGIRINGLQHQKGDFGYWIRKDQWGKGFATEASLAILNFGFEKLGLNRIWATAAPENKASLRVLEKVGLQYEGVLRQDVYIRGKYRDSVMMSILKSEWLASH